MLHFCHRYHPTGQVGGDFFNVLRLSDSKAGLFMCDVMGHGVRSALVTAMVRALVEELRPVAMDPGQLLTRINSDLRAILQQTGTPLFTTAFYMTADLENREILFANAGHPKPFLIHRLSDTGRSASSTHDGKSRPALGLVCRLHLSDRLLPVGGGRRGHVVYGWALRGGRSRRPAIQPRPAPGGRSQELGRLHCGDLFDAILDEIQQFSSSEEFADDVCLVGLEVDEKF